MSVGLNTHPVFLLACLVAAGLLTYWTYRHTTPRLSQPIKSILVGLRFLALAIVLFLLFDPIVTRSADQERPPVLALLIDNSASQTLTDENLLRQRLREADIASLDGSVELFAFDVGSRSLGQSPSAIDSLTFEGGRTNIGQAIEHVLRDQREKNIQSVILVSDGIYNTGRNPIYAAEESIAPIHTVVTGDTSRFQDVRIRDVNTNEIAYAGNELPVRVRVLSDGFSGESVSVAVRSSSTTVSQETIELAGDGTEQTVDLSVTPAEAGLMLLTVSVTELEGEATHQNNSRTVSIRVIDSRRRILLIAGSPDPDVGALRQALSDDPSFELETYIQRDPRTFYEGMPPRQPDDVDLIVLAGFPHARASAEIVDRVRNLISEADSPILFIAGRRMQTEAIREWGDAVLPVLPSGAVSTTHEAQPSLTSAGRSHPIMGGFDGGLEAWNSLPPLVLPDAGWTPSADASVLARVRSRGVDLDDPLIVIRTRAGRRTAALLGYDLWRWRTLAPSFDESAGLFDQFARNVVQWLTTPADDRLVRVQSRQDRFEGGEPVVFSGEVYDERLQPVSDAELRVTIESDDGDAFPYSMTSEGNGRYSLDAGALPEGTYRFTAEATRGTVSLGSDRGSFSVGALELEFRETRADAALMRQVAARTGGRSTSLEHFPDLIREVMSAPDFEPAVERVVRESSLRHTYLLLILALLFLASEWILRKRSGMV